MIVISMGIRCLPSSSFFQQDSYKSRKQADNKGKQSTILQLGLLCKTLNHQLRISYLSSSSDVTPDSTGVRQRVCGVGYLRPSYHEAFDSIPLDPWKPQEHSSSIRQTISGTLHFIIDKYEHITKGGWPGEREVL